MNEPVEIHPLPRFPVIAAAIVFIGRGIRRAASVSVSFPVSAFLVLKFPGSLRVPIGAVPCIPFAMTLTFACEGGDGTRTRRRRC